MALLANNKPWTKHEQIYKSWVKSLAQGHNGRMGSSRAQNANLLINSFATILHNVNIDLPPLLLRNDPQFINKLISLYFQKYFYETSLNTWKLLRAKYYTATGKNLCITVDC